MVKKLICLFLCLLLIVPCGVLAFADTGEKVIYIFHTNDIHGAALETAGKDGILTNMGFARAKTYINSQRADGKLLLDAGDMLQGIPFATIRKGDTMAQLAKAMGYQAIVPGNHDFDYGFDRLIELQKQYNLPIMAANVMKDGKAVFPASQIKEVAGIKIGIFALSTPETAYKTNPNNVTDVSFGTPEQLYETARKTVEDLKENEGAQIIVALTHLGSENWAQPSSLQLAKEVKGIDLIIDGHSHSALDGGIKIGDTLIVSTGDSMNNLGVVTFQMTDGKLTSRSAKLVTAAQMQQVQPDAAITYLCNQLSKEIKPELSKVIATAATDLDGEWEHIRSQSTNLGRLVCYAMMDETGADLAMVNGGSIRASISAGSVTKGDLAGVLPFGNIGMTVKMKGSALRTVLENAMVVREGSFPQFAGITVSAHVIQNTEDDAEYTQYLPDQILVKGKPLEDEREYVVAINDFMYAGGDFVYEPFAEGMLVNEYGALEEMFARYLPKANMAAINREQVLVLTQMVDSTAKKPLPETGRGKNSFGFFETDLEAAA